MAQNPVKISTKLIVIGGSSGSLDALLNIFASLDKAFDIAIIIVMHRNSDPNTSLVELLSAKTNLSVKEADEKEMILPGYIYVAPPDYHLLIEKDKSLSLDDSEKVKYSRPSIDVTFQSAADAYKNNLVAVLLSGANADGSEGIAYIKTLGGKAVIQNPAEALFAYMPQKAISQTKVDGVFNATEIGNYLNRLNKEN